MIMLVCLFLVQPRFHHTECYARYGPGRCNRIVRLVLSEEFLWTNQLSFSDYTGSQTRLNKILLNGNNICMVGCTPYIFRPRLTLILQLIPGGEGPAGPMV